MTKHRRPRYGFSSWSTCIPRTTRWRVDNRDIECLGCIIHNKPWLYLDEIQEELLYERSKFFHESNVWKMLDDIDYSLQVLTEPTSQHDEAERLRYKIGVTKILLDPSMAIFIDDNSKGRNAS
jgi:hypothetical protein